MAARDRYDVNKIRQQIKKKLRRERDPTEFRPPKAEKEKSYKFRFIILPPFDEGDPVDGGEASATMEEFFVTDGAHWLENKRLGCPRAIHDDKCEICQLGFDLLKETDEKEKRTKILKDIISNQYYKVNIYFPPLKNNPTPQEYVGKVFWFNAPKTVFDKWWDCICRDNDGGDPDDPEAFGVFFDELSAYVFQLEVVLKGLGNNYEKSKFLATRKPRALSVKDGKPNEAKIKEVLAMRHDLFTKRADTDLEEVKRIAINLGADVDEGGGGFDGDETTDKKKSGKKSEKKSSKPKPKPKKSKKPDPEPEPEPEPEDDDDDVVEDDDDVVEDDPIVDESGDDEGDDDDAVEDDESEESGDDDEPGDDGDDDDDDDEVDDLLAQLEDND